MADIRNARRESGFKMETESGIDAKKPRVKEALDAISGNCGTHVDLVAALSECPDNIVCKALTGNLAVSNWAEFNGAVIAIFEDIKREIHDGAPADYIPILASANPEWFSVSICTVDGQQFSYGDTEVAFSIQSCTKPIMYATAVEDRGLPYVHRTVGFEPSGLSFNEVSLNSRRKPHNPYINSGAIATGSLIGPGKDSAAKFRHFVKKLSEMAGEDKIGFSHATYLCEHETAWRNNALVAFMTDAGVFPKNCDPKEALDFYLQCCSIEVTTEISAAIAATLACGGICPLTGFKALHPITVKSTLSLMFSCGMYDYSGTWMSEVDLPAKSGVAGLIYCVIPHVMGVAVFSPPLDSHGNSVRGIEFCKRLLKRYPCGVFDQIVAGRQHSAVVSSSSGAAAGVDVKHSLKAAGSESPMHRGIPTARRLSTITDGELLDDATATGSAASTLTSDVKSHAGVSVAAGSAAGRRSSTSSTRRASVVTSLSGVSGIPVAPKAKRAVGQHLSAHRLDAWLHVFRQVLRLSRAIRRIRVWAGLPLTQADLRDLVAAAGHDEEAPRELQQLSAGVDVKTDTSDTTMPLAYEYYKAYRVAAALINSNEKADGGEGGSDGVTASAAPVWSAFVGGLEPTSTSLPAAALQLYMNAHGIDVTRSYPHVFTLWNAILTKASGGSMSEATSLLIPISLPHLMVPGEHKNTIVKTLLGNAAIPYFAAFVNDMVNLYETILRKEPTGEVYSALEIDELTHADPHHFAISIVTVDGQMVHIGDTSVEFPLMGTVRPLLYALACKDVGIAEVGRWVGVEPTAAGTETFNLIPAVASGHGSAAPASPPPKVVQHTAPGTGSGTTSGSAAVGASTPDPSSLASLVKGVIEGSVTSPLSGKPVARPAGFSPISSPPFSTGSTRVPLASEYLTVEPTRGPHPKPYNAFLDSGALAVAALVGRAHYPPDKRLFHDNGSRFSHMLSHFESWCGGRRVGFNNSVYLAQKQKRLKTLAISYYAKGMGVYPTCTDPSEAAHYLFQAEAVEMTSENLAIMAATFANIGVCPLTQQRCLEPAVMRTVLSGLYSSGLGPYSGHFMFTAGIPSAAGTSGAHMIVIPGLMGIAIYSPGLLKGHNVPQRSARFCELLTSKYRVNLLDQLVFADAAVEIDPSQRSGATSTMEQSLLQFELCTAAGAGNVAQVKELIDAGADVNICDYDLRTALHIACSDGHPEIVKLLLDAGAHVLVSDRWGNTPYHDARRAGCAEALALLEESLGGSSRATGRAGTDMDTARTGAETERTCQ